MQTRKNIAAMDSNSTMWTVHIMWYFTYTACTVYICILRAQSTYIRSSKRTLLRFFLFFFPRGFPSVLVLSKKKKKKTVYGVVGVWYRAMDFVDSSGLDRRCVYERASARRLLFVSALTCSQSILASSSSSRWWMGARWHARDVLKHFMASGQD